ncbi:hypothetical protein [Tenacibaculum sp. 190524A02b]|uniref:hypothetical protein n=1 Tax=Tenacibaculum vairaonense TaxID=3137860 RepID=UPI0031FB6A69
MELFYDNFKKVNLGSLNVTIHDIGWLPVDTNLTTVFFAVIKGMELSLDFKIDNFLVDFDNNRITYPIY